MPKDSISQQKEDKTPCKALHTAQRQKGQSLHGEDSGPGQGLSAL